MALPDFGQYVKLTVKDIGNRTIFTTDNLRIDFDVMKQQGYSTAKVEIYNLDKATIKRITGDELFVTIHVSQHGSPLKVLIDKFYISNSTHELKLPNAITSLYCYSNLKFAFLDKQLEEFVKEPSIKRSITQMAKAVGFNGSIIYKTFPKGHINYIPFSPVGIFVGSFGGELARYGRENEFSFYTEGNDLVVVYKPTQNNVDKTDLKTGKAEISLTVSQMKANPKLGQAEINITSNLNLGIIAGHKMDVSKLLTASVDVDKETLALADGLIKDTVAGYDRYLVITIEHRGSNYTKEWTTFVYGTYPSRGTTMKTKTWYLRGYT